MARKHRNQTNEPHPDTVQPDLSTMVPPEEFDDSLPTVPEVPIDEQLPHEPLTPVTFVLPDLDASPGPGYCRQHIDVKLSHAEARKFRRLQDALQREGTCLVSTGRPIERPGDVVKWILQQIPE